MRFKGDEGGLCEGVYGNGLLLRLGRTYLDYPSLRTCIVCEYMRD
jgi:hypothetical protein